MKLPSLYSTLWFDALGTGVLSAMVALFHTQFAGPLGLSPQYILMKFGCLTLYGSLVLISLPKQPYKISKWLVHFACIANLCFGIESAWLLFINQTMAPIAKLMMQSIIPGSIIFPILFYKGFTNQENFIN